MFRSIGHAVSTPARLLAGAVTAGLDRLNGLVSRWYDRYDEGFSERTKLLRARYARRTDLQVNPPPTIGGIADRADLATGKDVKTAA